MSKPYAKFATEDNLKAVGRRMRLFRMAVAGHMSQKEFCSLIGVTPQSWANYEIGAGYPNPHVISALWEMYGLDHAWVYHGSEAGMLPPNASAKAETLLKLIHRAEAAEKHNAQADKRATAVA